MMIPSTITLDGSLGEGGGQVLRTALSLSMVTGRPLRIERIRARRPKPGLMRQHLACVQAAVQISGGEALGAELTSQSLQFTPGPVHGGDYRFEINSAGSCLLVLQTVLPALMLADSPSRLTLTGGTHNPMAPPFEFLDRAFAPLLRRLGARLELTLLRRGFYPAGGGLVEASITPAAQPLIPFDLDGRGPLQQAWAESCAPGLARSIAPRELEALGRELGWNADQLLIPPVRQNEGPGNALLATLAHEEVGEVFCQLGARGVTSEQVAHQLAEEVRAFEASTAAVGPHLADQWMLPLALAVWRSGRPAHYTASAITLHAETNAQVIGQCLPVRVTMTPGAGATRIALAPAA